MTGISRREFPSGPWVVVVGMHRSGTSALTEALAGLGLSLPHPRDTQSGGSDRPSYFESVALGAFDNDLLGHLGGTWSAPPTLEPAWEEAPAVRALIPSAQRAAWRAFPNGGPLIWKDPRVCLLLPWWRSILPSPLATIFVWRSPVAVAQSLRSRNGFILSHGLSLWEFYNRHALTALAGHDCFALKYETLVEDPKAVIGAVADWLFEKDCLPAKPGHAEIEQASTSVSKSFSRSDGEGELPPTIRHDAAVLADLDGAYQAFPGLHFESPPRWMGDIIQQRRQYETAYAQYLRYAKWRRKIPVLKRASRRATTSNWDGATVHRVPDEAR